MVSWAHHPSPQPKQYLDQFSRCCKAHDCDRPTDHATWSLTIGCTGLRIEYCDAAYKMKCSRARNKLRLTTLQDTEGYPHLLLSTFDISPTLQMSTTSLCWANATYHVPLIWLSGVMTRLCPTTTTTVLWPFFRDHPSELVPEENFLTTIKSRRED